ncbi:MAG: hypothetical protein IH621_03105 [Krumholzibacteria bacterium]|nr:hypothetical protein [Candidatus Krumholzibacteria bacterium]
MNTANTQPNRSTDRPPAVQQTAQTLAGRKATPVVIPRSEQAATWPSASTIGGVWVPDDY